MKAATTPSRGLLRVYKPSDVIRMQLFEALDYEHRLTNHSSPEHHVEGDDAGRAVLALVAALGALQALEGLLHVVQGHVHTLHSAHADGGHV